jgi:TP901 family phage tail tape measure protein
MAGKKVVGEIIASIRLKHAQFEDDLKQTRKKFGKLGKDIDRIGRDISRKFGLSFAGIGTAAFIASKQIDDAVSSIRRSTGATGKALEGLKKDFLSVSKGVPDSFAQVSKAIGDLNTRLGLSGEPLQALAKQTVNLARITGEDLGAVIQTNTRVFGDWGIALDQTAEAQDFLFKVSQSTGIGLTRLGDLIVKYGAPLRQFGFDFETAATLMGKFDKEGVNTEVVFSGLRQALGKLSKAGLELKPSLETIMQGIKDAGSAALANQAAIAVFGQEAGPDMAAAVREGRFEISELINTLKSSGETINKAATESETFTEKLQKLGKVILLAIAPIGEAINRIFGPLVDTLTSAFTYLAEAMSGKFGKAMGDVIVVLGTFAAAIGPVILAVKGLIVIFGLLIGWPALIIGAFAGLYVAWKVWGDDVKAFFNDLWKSIQIVFAKMQARVYQLSNFLGNLSNLDTPWEAWSKTANDYQYALNQLTSAQKSANDKAKEGAVSAEDYSKKLSDAAKVTGDLKNSQASGKPEGLAFNELLAELAKTGGGAAKELEKTAEKVKKLKEEWASYLSEFKTSIDQEVLQKGIAESLNNFDKATFDKFATKMRESIEQETFGKLSEKYKDIIPESAIREQAQKEAKIKADEFGQQWDDKQKEVYQEGIDFWQTTFENAITGVKFDLKDALKQVAVGFAAELAQSVLGSIQGIKSPKDLGSAIFGSIFGGGSGTEIGKVLGIDIGGFLKDSLKEVGLDFGKKAGAELTGVAGKWGLTAGTAMGLAGVTYLYGKNALDNGAKDVIQGKGNSKQNFDTALNSNLITGWVNPLLGALGLGSAGGILGLGKKHPETQARRDFAAAIQKMVKEVAGGSVLMKDAFGNWKEWTGKTNILGGDSKFDTSKGFDFFNSMTDGAKGTFSALGTAFKEVFKLDKLDGAQAGAILSENLGGSIDNLRSLVFSLKLNFEDLKGAMLTSAEEGKISWGEYNTTIAGLGEAFKPGLSAVGDLTGAVDELISTGGKGLKAVKAVKDIAVEGMEAGASKVSELEAALISAGRSTEEAHQIAVAFGQSGTDSLKEIADGSNEFAGQIAGNLELAGFGYAELSEKVDQLNKGVNSLNDIELKPKILEIQVVGTGDIGLIDDQVSLAALGGVFTDITKFAKGGIVNTPTLFNHSGGAGLMGEAGPEAILPLSRGRGGKLGVQMNGASSGGIVINVDARGSAPGVENDIIAAIEAMGNEAVQRSVVAVADYINRTGGF